MESCLPRLKQFALQSAMTYPQDSASCFLDIKCGAGGRESNDFVSLLARMYHKWCARQPDFTLSVIDEVHGEGKSYKSVSMHVKGLYAHGWLKHESGIHRLTRVSPYDSSQRRQTSFASVTVSPESANYAQLKDIKVHANDIHVEVMRSNGAVNVQAERCTGKPNE